MDTPRERTRYSDSELEEFRVLITDKISKAKEELKYYTSELTNEGNNGTDDTSNQYITIEEGTAAMEKEQLTQLAGRQRKFIKHLEDAMIRIENKTYGICRNTGKLISKERLRIVPHTTLSIEAKLQEKK